MKVKIKRFKQTDVHTIGRLTVEDQMVIWRNYYLEHFVCYSLELPDKGNQQNISRIPEGIYQCKKGRGWKIPYLHIHVLDVPDRTGIRIHRGNFHSEIQGCILVGNNLSDIDEDGYLDVTNSKATLKTILSMLPDRFELEIIDEQ